MKRILAALALATPLWASAADVLGVPQDVYSEYVFSVHVCRRVDTGKAEVRPCVTTATSRIAGMVGDSAHMANFREVGFVAPAPVPLPASASTPAPTTGAVAPSAVAPSAAEASRPVRQTVKVGYELSLKPLYETDGIAYIQYDLAASQITRWVPVEGGPPDEALHRPDLQGVKLSGTDKLRVGQSFKVERGGYVFEIKLLSADLPTSY